MAGGMRGFDPSLTRRGRLDTEGRIIIAHHLILYSYGPLFPKGSGGGPQEAIPREKPADFGAGHVAGKHGRSPQSKLHALRNQARRPSEFPLLWFDEAKRRAVGAGFAEVVRRRRYTVWACAVLENCAHLCVRTHRDSSQAMWHEFAEESQSRLRLFADVADNHPIWSEWLCVISLCTPGDVCRAVVHIGENPAQENLPPQAWPFVQPYDGWPYPKPLGK